MAVESIQVQGREQRIGRWQALLEGTSSCDGTAARARKRGPTNLLLGVWLHAATRAEQGLDLTDFEATVLAPLSNVFGDGEVNAVGRLYGEQRAKGRSPEVIAGRRPPHYGGFHCAAVPGGGSGAGSGCARTAEYADS
jgi:hypothetical protein